MRKPRCAACLFGRVAKTWNYHVVVFNYYISQLFDELQTFIGLKSGATPISFTRLGKRRMYAVTKKKQDLGLDGGKFTSSRYFKMGR